MRFAILSRWMYRWTKITGSSLAANVQPDRGRSEGVFRLSGSLWFGWCCAQLILFSKFLQFSNISTNDQQICHLTFLVFVTAFDSRSNLWHLSLSARTEVCYLSFMNIAPLLRLFVSKLQVPSNTIVFLCQPKPKSAIFLSWTLHHFWGCLFQNCRYHQIPSPFFVSQNRSLQSSFHEHCTASEAVCSKIAGTIK